MGDGMGDGVAEPGGYGTRRVGPVTIYKSYAKSIPGIVKVFIMAVSLIGFICVTVADWYCGWGAPRFFEFTTMTSFWAVVVLYTAFLTGVNKAVYCINWELTELIWSGVDGGFYLISSSILAAKTCGDASLAAGAVFGFMATIAFGINTFFAFKALRETHVVVDSPKSHPTEPPPAYTP